MFTAGYFNIHPDYRKKLIDSSPANGVVVTAAPEVRIHFEYAMRSPLNDPLIFRQMDSISHLEYRVTCHQHIHF